MDFTILPLVEYSVLYSFFFPFVTQITLLFESFYVYFKHQQMAKFSSVMTIEFILTIAYSKLSQANFFSQFGESKKEPYCNFQSSITNEVKEFSICSSNFIFCK